MTSRKNAFEYIDFLRNGQYSTTNDSKYRSGIDIHGNITIQGEYRANRIDYILTEKDTQDNYQLKTKGLLNLKRWKPIAAEESNGKNICIFENSKTNKIRYVVCNKKWKAKRIYKPSRLSRENMGKDFDARLSRNSFAQLGVNKNGFASIPTISDASGDGTPSSLF